jgi:hypothetical protein
MKKRTIFLLTISMLLVLAFVQVTLVAAEEGDGYSGDGYVCDNPEGCSEGDSYTEDVPGDGGTCPDGVVCDDPPPVDECENGNPGNAKCVGKAGEKEDMGGFWVDPDPNGNDPGTHGRSDPDKHPNGHPTE